MSNIPDDLKYTKDHEWLRMEGDTATVGVTDYAQTSLGDVTFVELPAVGERYDAGESFGVVESVKAASDLYMPLSGEIIGVNEALDAAPEGVNEDPYGAAWLIKIKPDSPAGMDGLLTPEQYRELAGE